MSIKHTSIDPILDELIEKYGTDKNLGNYNLGYAQVFKEIKHKVKSVLEIGIGSMTSTNSNFSGIINHYPFYKPGGSLRVWRDYFPNAIVHGVDIGEDCLLEEDRIRTFIFSSMDLYKCKQNLYNFEYDVIIDDGDHSAISQLITFKNLAPLLKKGGYYFIEDLGGYQGYQEPDGTWYRPELLGEFKNELYKTAEKHKLTVTVGRPLMIH